MYWLLGLVLAFLIGVGAIWHDKRMPSSEKAATRLPFLRLQESMVSLKSFTIAISLIFVIGFFDYFYNITQSIVGLWLFILPCLYIFISLIFFGSFYGRGGKARLETYKSMDAQKITESLKKDSLYPAVILAVLAIYFLYYIFSNFIF